MNFYSTRIWWNYTKKWKKARKSSRVALLSFSKGRQILRVESENRACLLWTKFRIIWTLNTQPAHSLPLIYPFTIKSYISILLAVCHKYWSDHFFLATYWYYDEKLNNGHYMELKSRLPSSRLTATFNFPDGGWRITISGPFSASNRCSTKLARAGWVFSLTASTYIETNIRNKTLDLKQSALIFKQKIRWKGFLRRLLSVLLRGRKAIRNKCYIC